MSDKEVMDDAQEEDRRDRADQPGRAVGSRSGGAGASAHAREIAPERGGTDAASDPMAIYRAAKDEAGECVVCGEPAQQHSAWCRRCAAALEEDRLNRETYG